MSTPHIIPWQHRFFFLLLCDPKKLWLPRSAFQVWQVRLNINLTSGVKAGVFLHEFWKSPTESFRPFQANLISGGQAHKRDPAGAVTSKLHLFNTQGWGFLCSGSSVMSRVSGVILTPLHSAVVSHLLQPDQVGM